MNEMYGVLVHSCFVEDGQGEKQLIIDKNGCHTDHTLLGDPTYVEALNMAYRESYVFKFADRTAVRFQCEIRLCLKEDGGCDGVTPPLCIDETHNRINQLNRTLRRRRSSFPPRDADLISQYVYVLDTAETPPNSALGLNGSWSSTSTLGYSPSMICMSSSQVLFFVVCIGVGLLLLLSLVTYAVCLKINRDMATELERRDQCYQKTKQSDSFD